jgi:hypothetical protein
MYFVINILSKVNFKLRLPQKLLKIFDIFQDYFWELYISQTEKTFIGLFSE